ncbi:MAG: diacylglycerol kinase (ATP) [Pseudohongiellaceae bacterium]|jgi:diacylglycerol kinase (ATP)
MNAQETVEIKPPRKKTGIRRIIAATKYSIDGLKLAAKTESAFKQELIASLFLLPLAIWLGENAIEQSLLIASVVMIMIVELLNTAVEAVVDRVSSDFHELSRQAKDLGSAAVFLSISLAILVWVLLLLN